MGGNDLGTMKTCLRIDGYVMHCVPTNEMIGSCISASGQWMITSRPLRLVRPRPEGLKL